MGAPAPAGPVLALFLPCLSCPCRCFLSTMVLFSLSVPASVLWFSATFMNDVCLRLSNPNILTVLSLSAVRSLLPVVRRLTSTPPSSVVLQDVVFVDQVLIHHVVTTWFPFSFVVLPLAQLALSVLDLKSLSRPPALMPCSQRIPVSHLHQPYLKSSCALSILHRQTSVRSHLSHHTK